MAIRLVMPAPGAIYGAYVSGVGRARQRQQKYQLDLLRDRQIMRNRQAEQMQAFKYRSALQDQRYGGRLGTTRRSAAQIPQGGTVIDPLQQALEGPTGFYTGDKANRANAVRIRAQRQANERAMRMGRAAPYPDANVRFDPGPTQEQIEDFASNTRSWGRAVRQNLPEIPDNADAATRKKLNSLIAEMEEYLGPRFDLTEPEIYEQFQNAMEEYRDIASNVPDKDIAAQMNKESAWWDPNDQMYYNEPGLARVRVGPDGLPIDMTTPQQKEEQERQKEQEEERKEAEKEREKERKAQIKEQEKRIYDELKGLRESERDLKVNPTWLDERNKTEAENRQKWIDNRRTELQQQLDELTQEDDEMLSPDGKWRLEDGEWKPVTGQMF